MIRFLSIALGSATELELQLRLANRLDLADNAGCEATMAHTREEQRMLTGLILRLRPALEAS